MSLNDMDDERKKSAYLLSLSLSMKRYAVQNPRPWLMFIGIAILIGLILAMAYLWQ